MSGTSAVGANGKTPASFHQYVDVSVAEVTFPLAAWLVTSRAPVARMEVAMDERDRQAGRAEFVEDRGQD